MTRTRASRRRAGSRWRSRYPQIQDRPRSLARRGSSACCLTAMLLCCCCVLAQFVAILQAQEGRSNRLLPFQHAHGHVDWRPSCDTVRGSLFSTFVRAVMIARLEPHCFRHSPSADSCPCLFQSFISPRTAICSLSWKASWSLISMHASTWSLFHGVEAVVAHTGRTSNCPQ